MRWQYLLNVAFAEGRVSNNSTASLRPEAETDVESFDRKKSITIQK